MGAILDPARSFFEACETGRGWSVCQKYRHPDAAFSSQTTALADIASLKKYCEWMKNLFVPTPDGHYELKFFAVDDSNQSVAAIAVFHGTQTGPGGPVPATGNSVAAHNVYHMVFDRDRIKHMTRIWNDAIRDFLSDISASDTKLPLNDRAR